MENREEPQETIAPGSLHIVATPIGNLGDISKRAIDILGRVDLIACEDTRTSAKLLGHYGIRTPTISYHEHNESARARQLLERLKTGQSLALICDAGTPGLSDPGFRLVRGCRRLGVPVHPVPGPFALAATLSASGLPTNGFLFAGFLAPKTSARRRFFERYRDFEFTLCLYESSHRITKMADDIVAVLGPERTVCFAKELTKRYEAFYTGTADSVRTQLLAASRKGEFVVLVAPEGFAL